MLVAAGLLAASATGAGAAPQPGRPVADSPPARSRTPPSGTTAPSGPPLAGAQTPPQEPSGGDAVDPLAGNGLTSPLCAPGAIGVERGAADARNCEASGFAPAPDPTGDYGVDVHIDTGFLGLSEGGLLSAVQDILIAPAWMAIVWIVHALLVMLEWAFTLDLLDSIGGGSIGSGLRQMQASLTVPGLALALAVASVLTTYNGLIKRRVAESVAHALAALSMIACSLWVIADPVGTVGAVGAWANEASLGALAAAAKGSPARSGSALSAGLGGVFATAVEGPWCYLEFGDVAWCREPSRLDPRMHRAGLAIAGTELLLSACKPESPNLLPCAGGNSAEVKSLRTSAKLLRSARSNAQVFLALPANGWARNSISKTGTLLRVLCASSEATNCRGPTAAQAEFRTNGGTWARFGGLVMIAAGFLGMGLLIGLIAVRLLGAALYSLFLLFLTPAIALAPAFGSVGRELFRRWATHLLGALVGKVVFAFLLGVVFAVGAAIQHMNAVGWWIQWLLTSAFWWIAFLRRGLAYSLVRPQERPGAAHNASVLRQTRDALLGGSRVQRAAQAIRERRRAQKSAAEPTPLAGAGAPVTRAGRESAPALANELDDQARRSLDADENAARAIVAGAPNATRRVDALKARLARIRQEQHRAQSRGDVRRRVALEVRGERLERAIASVQSELSAARAVARHDPAREPGPGGGAGRARPARGSRSATRSAYLDSQAALPAAGRAEAGHRARRRDYAGLASLAGLGRREYEHLTADRQREIRAQIDRELAHRRQLTDMRGDLVSSSSSAQAGAHGRRPGAGGRERVRRSEGAPPQSVNRREGPSRDASRTPHDGAGGPAADRSADGPIGSTGAARRRRRPETPRAVLEDAWEVQEGRKRQLGNGYD